jgi:polysaccharide export outer membrane protein
MNRITFTGLCLILGWVWMIPLLLVSPEEGIAFQKPEPTAAMKKLGNAPGESGDLFVMGPEDIIEISVWGNKEFGGAMPVRPDGYISFPLIGDIKAQGKTPNQLKIIITEKLREYIKDASVAVFVREVNSINISIAGEVNSPGTYKINRPITLLHLISIAKGFTNKVDLKKSYLFRDGHRLDIDFYSLIKKGDFSQNIWLKRNDIIFIQDNFENRVNVMGEVKKPQVITYQEGMTVLDAIQIAEGTTDIAKPNGTKIYRRSNKEQKEPYKIFPVELDEVYEGDLSKNLLLEPGDMIHVPRSFF